MGTFNICIFYLKYYLLCICDKADKCKIPIGYGLNIQHSAVYWYKDRFRSLGHLVNVIMATAGKVNGFMANEG